MNFMKSLRKRHIFLLTLIVVYSFALVHIVQAVTAATAEPGSEGNPLVSQDYVDSRLSTLTATIDSLKKQVEQSSKFEKISLKAGKQIVAGAGTEIILRTGSAKAVGSVEGGLSDIISGKDITTGNLIPRNHLVVIPADDGRGLKTVTDSWLIIKGTYSIK